MLIDLARDVPLLRAVFQKMLPGYHLSSDDFELYHELQKHEDRYQALLQALGYVLHADRRGYYYLSCDDDSGTLNATTAKMALVIFTLVEYLADQGRDPFERITQGELPLVETCDALFAKHRELLIQGGLESSDALQRCLGNSFVRLGFVSVNADQLRFRPPVVRFLDLCSAAGSTTDSEPDSKADSDSGEEQQA